MFENVDRVTGILLADPGDFGSGEQKSEKSSL